MKISKIKKHAVMDKCGGRCAYCGVLLIQENATQENLKHMFITIDHIIPVSKGGRNNIDNLLPCCKSCNSTKSKNTLERFKYVFLCKKQGIPIFTQKQLDYLEIVGNGSHLPKQEMFYYETIERIYI